jgi:hypothetical protein
VTAFPAPHATASEFTANPFPDLAGRTVLLAGGPTTYANRAYLCALGLRWDPERRQWYGTTTAERVRVPREQLDLEVRCFGMLEPPRGPTPPPRPIRAVSKSVPSIRELTRRPRDGSRTDAEARTVYREDEPACSRFSDSDITSGLPDDSREGDERADAHPLHDRRARVKAARAVVSTTPGLADTLRGDWQKSAGLFARFGITEATFRKVVLDWGVATRESAKEIPDVARSTGEPSPPRFGVQGHTGV